MSILRQLERDLFKAAQGRLEDFSREATGASSEESHSANGVLRTSRSLVHGAQRGGFLRVPSGAVTLTFSVVVVLVVAVLAVALLGHTDLAANRSGKAGPPVGGPVPAGFEPLWVSAISDQRWWVLGERPCARTDCLAIVRTTNGGRSFAAIPTPSASYRQAGCSVPSVSRLTFVNRLDGFAYGAGCPLYVTHDGGARWRRANLGGYVEAMTAADGYVYAIVINRHSVGVRLVRSPIGQDAWKTLLRRRDLEPEVAAAGRNVFVQVAHGKLVLLISHNRGMSFSPTNSNSIGLSIICVIQPMARQVVWGLCSGGHMESVVRSTDGGRSFQGADGGTNGTGASNEANGAAFDAIDASSAIVGYGQLLRTTDAGRHWTPVGPKGLAWQSLMFVDKTFGIGIAGPASSAPAGSRVYYTDNGGLTFHAITIGSTAQESQRTTLTRRCTSSALQLRPGMRVSEKTEQSTRLLILRNASATGCYIEGYPRITLLDRHGTVLRFRYLHHGDQTITNAKPSDVRLTPGGNAYFALNTTDACAAYGPLNATRLRFRLPNGGRALSIAIGLYPQLNYRGGRWFIDVTPIEPTINAAFARP
jgi:photosystem II stability/assembly factor-like uncharacterized protein